MGTNKITMPEENNKTEKAEHQGEGGHPNLNRGLVAPYSGIIPTDASGVVTGLGKPGEKSTSLAESEGAAETVSEEDETKLPDDDTK